MQEGLVALVTGGSRGIGAETALALANHGFDVALTFRNKAAHAAEVANAIAQQGRQALVLGCDITRTDDVAQLFEQVGQWKGYLIHRNYWNAQHLV